MRNLLIGLFLMVVFGACNNGSDKATVSFSLTDAPSLKGYKAVYVDVQSVEYMVDSGEFVALPITPVVVNLLDLTNGQDTLLGNVELEAGQSVSQVRLILGTDNSLVLADGSEVALTTPSAQSSGLKFNIQSDVTVTSGYKVMIDFDAEKSVVAKGNGGYSLKPVIRGYIVANTSQLYGYIVPANVPFKVMAIRNPDTILTVSDTLLNNFFMLHGLTSGTYEIQFVDATNAIRKSFLQEVHGGSLVELDTVVLNP